MPDFDEAFLQTALALRAQAGTLRQLPGALPDGWVDFASNDYLSLARSARLQATWLADLQTQPPQPGSTGSRLLTGDSATAHALEAKAAAFHQAEAALLFGSGYAANLGLLSAVASRQDTLLLDAQCHASLKEGAMASQARVWKFRHNDPTDLETKLKSATGRVFVVTEAVFSMSGQLAPLPEMAAICQARRAYLIVDEAHSVGLYGPSGEGLVPALGLQDLVWARIVAFGKAFASNGAMVLGSRTLKAYLVNFARSFIYTTAPAEAGLRWLQGVYREMPNLQTARSQLEKLARNAAELFPQAAPASPGLPAHLAWSPILPLPIADLARLPHLRSQLQAAQIDLRPILPPTVPKGQAIWRVNLHSHNTLAELQTLADILG